MTYTKALVGCVLGLVVGCGGTGSGAALQVSLYPSDRGQVNTSRANALARTYEETAECTARDTIVIQGVAPLTYTVEGCGPIAVYTLQCRAHPTGYANICDWLPAGPELLAVAAPGMTCRPASMDAQPAQPGQPTRTVMGCGYAADYRLTCSGPTQCTWSQEGPVRAAGAAAPAASAGSNYVAP